MGTTYRFISDPSAPQEVAAWFRTLEAPPTEVPTERGATLYFKSAGQLAYKSDGVIDPKTSPLASMILPRIRRGVLWTVGEVHFLAAPLRQRFPALHKISSEFSKWLGSHECVYSNKSQSNSYNYYLEGSIQNYDPPVFAFPSGIEALRKGQYFVADDDSEFRLDKLCQSLRLRGVVCSQA
jgi:hypothetical protein